jgi:hypothetical protein
MSCTSQHLLFLLIRHSHCLPVLLSLIITTLHGAAGHWLSHHVDGFASPQSTSAPCNSPLATSADNYQATSASSSDHQSKLPGHSTEQIQERSFPVMMKYSSSLPSPAIIITTASHTASTTGRERVDQGHGVRRGGIARWKEPIWFAVAARSISSTVDSVGWCMVPAVGMSLVLLDHTLPDGRPPGLLSVGYLVLLPLLLLLCPR